MKNINVSENVVHYSRRQRRIDEMQERMSVAQANADRRHAIEKAERKKNVFKTKVGLATAVLVAGSIMYAGSKVPTWGKATPVYNEEKVISFQENKLNELRLVLVNDGANTTIFDRVSKKLEEDGVIFRTIKGSDNLDFVCEQDTVVSFVDYQGSGAKVIAQYQERANQSDSLALGLKASLDKRMLTKEKIQCGVHEIKGNDGSMLEPSILEKNIGDKSKQFVTLAVSTNMQYDLFSEAFVEGLARFQFYKEQKKEGNFITRVTAGSTLEGYAKEYDMSLEELEWKNGKQDFLSIDQTLRINDIPSELTEYQQVEVIKNSARKM